MEGTHFTFDVFSDPSYPDVTFKTGHSSIPWRVWSQVSATDATPAHLGDLFIDSTSSTDNYKIELRNPNNGNPGCVNLKSAVLRDATSWSGYSSLTDSEITGDLFDDLLVIPDGSGQGGELHLYVDGDVPADMTLHRVTRLQIRGAASGTIEIEDLAIDPTIGTLTGTLNIARTSGDNGGIRIFQPVSGSVTFSEVASDGFVVFMPSGITETGELSVGEFASSPQSVAFGVHQQMAGAITFLDGMPAFVTLTLKQVTTTGTITVDGELAGTVVVQGQLNGLLAADQITGSIAIEGCAVSEGSILVTGDLESGSDLTVLGDFSGEIVADADDSDGGAIYGDVSVEGDFSGYICGANLSAYDPLPSNIDLPNWRCGASRCGTLPFCPFELGAVVEGCRYLKLIAWEEEPSHAIRIVGDCTNPDFVDPECILDAYVQPDGSIDSEPYYQTGEDWGTLYVSGEALIPSLLYVVYSEPESDPSDRSTKRRRVLRIWGDTDEPLGAPVEVGDVLCVLDAYGEEYTSTCTLYSADIAPCEPDGLVEVADVLAVLDAYGEEPYPCELPCEESFTGGGSEQESFTLEVLDPTLAASTDETGIRVEVYATLDGTVRGFQAAFDVTGAEVLELVVDAEREDFVFAGLEEGVDFVVARNVNAGRFAVVLFAGHLEAAREVYLGTIRISAEAESLAVALREGQTKFIDADRKHFAAELGEDAAISLP